MYHPPGEYVTDFCIVRRDDVYHLFHIRGERWTWPLGYREIDLGHAISTDLVHWQQEDPVLPVGEPGAWDECGNWAPDIIEVDGVYYLYYTGSDRNNNQKIGLATSTDLYTWTFHPANPVVEPGPWSDRHVGRDVAGRDPMVFADRERDRYLMYYTATTADGRACIALVESDDLLHWRDRGPTYIEDDRTFNRLESAYLVERDGRYYLFYSAKGGPKSKGHAPDEYPHFDIVYLVSDDPTGGWQKPANHVLLAGWSCASEHPTFDGVTYMFYVFQEEVDGIWGASSLSDPKTMEWLPDGTVRIREHVPDTVTRRTLFDSNRDDSNRDSLADWVHHGATWQRSSAGVLTPPPPGDAHLLDTRWGRDLRLDAECRGDPGGVASLLVRSNPSALSGYRASLDFERGTLAFSLRFPGRADRLLQERAVSIQSREWHRLKITASGPFFELYVDDDLCMVHHDRLYDSGCFGLHARGDVAFRNVTITADADPQSAVDDWSQRCQPQHLFPTRPIHQTESGSNHDS